MRIWITEIAEPLPGADGHRLMRCGLLAERLVRAGHDVTWWSSSFDHISKSYRGAPGSTLEVSPTYRIHLLAGPPYRRNVSLARVRHHRAAARRLAERAPEEPRPDLVFSCLPTLEVTEVAVRYAQDRGIPAVVDVRDLWPDIFLHAFPRPVRAAIRLLLLPEYRRARFVLRNASAIIGVSEDYLTWGLQYAGRARSGADGVFPHGYPAGKVSTDELRAAEQCLRAAGVGTARVICCFVGMFGWTYDLAPVIETARELWRAGATDVQFVFAGSGDRELEWRALAEGIPSIVFTGWLPEAAVTALLRMSHIAVAAYAPGAPQGLPNKIFEYMSAGLPILSSLRGETERLLTAGRCGLSYDAARPQTFRAALAELLVDERRRLEMGQRGATRFEAEFSAARVYERLADHLARLGRSAH